MSYEPPSPYEPPYQPPPYQPPQPTPPPGHQPPPPYQPPQPTPPPGHQPPPPGGYQPPPPTPGYPPPPATGWQQPPKKSRKGLWITLGIIAAVLVLGVGGCVALLWGTLTAPVDESNNFLAEIDAGDYQGALDYVDASCGSAITAQALQDVFRGGDITYNLNNSQIVNSNATVRGSYSSTTDNGTNITINLLKRDGTWGICSVSVS